MNSLRYKLILRHIPRSNTDWGELHRTAGDCTRDDSYMHGSRLELPRVSVQYRIPILKQYAQMYSTGTEGREASMPNGTISRERHRSFSRNGTGTGMVYYR